MTSTHPRRLTRPQMRRALAILESAKRILVRQGDRCIRLAYAEADTDTKRAFDRLADAEIRVLANFSGGDR